MLLANEKLQGTKSKKVTFMLLSVNFAAEIGILGSPGLCLMEVMPHVVTMVSGVSDMNAIIRVWKVFLFLF